MLACWKDNSAFYLRAPVYADPIGIAGSWSMVTSPEHFSGLKHTAAVPDIIADLLFPTLFSEMVGQGVLV